jgi:hypothetical protein
VQNERRQEQLGRQRAQAERDVADFALAGALQEARKVLGLAEQGVSSPEELPADRCQAHARAIPIEQPD